MQKISPFLWFDTQAEEAARFYVSVFKNSSLGHVSYYGEEFPDRIGTAMVATFTLEGQHFMALNGGPQFTFSPAISFQVATDTQEEIDDLWGKLTDGGEESQCGWLKDKYGVSWQITPSILGKLMQDEDPKRGGRVTAALMKMKKIDIAGLKRAYDAASE